MCAATMCVCANANKNSSERKKCVRCEKKLPTSCLSDGTFAAQKNWSKRHHRGKLLKIKVFFNREKFKIPARSLLGLVKKFCGDLKKKLIKVIKTNSVSLYRESNSLTPVRYKGS